MRTRVAAFAIASLLIAVGCTASGDERDVPASPTATEEPTGDPAGALIWFVDGSSTWPPPTTVTTMERGIDTPLTPPGGPRSVDWDWSPDLAHAIWVQELQDDPGRLFVSAGSTAPTRSSSTPSEVPSTSRPCVLQRRHAVRLRGVHRRRHGPSHHRRRGPATDHRCTLGHGRGRRGLVARWVAARRRGRGRRCTGRHLHDASRRLGCRADLRAARRGGSRGRRPARSSLPAPRRPSTVSREST